MAITRVWQSGAELGGELEVTSLNGCENNTLAEHTGSRGYRHNWANSNPVLVDLPSPITQLRSSMYLLHNGFRSSGTIARVCDFRDPGDAVVIRLQWREETGDLELWVAGSVVDTVSAASVGFSQTGRWFHIGMDIKIASDGWAYVYLDGQLILSYDGDTTGSGIYTSISRFTFLGNVSGYGWESYPQADDLYIDDTTGETAPAKVPSAVFVPLTPNGNGDSSQWTGSDGDSVDNYLLVDDLPDDGDSTYVAATAANLVDLYNIETYTVPEGQTIRAIIPMAVAKKGDAADDVQIALVVKSGTTQDESTMQDLGTSYGPVWERWDTNPDTGAGWTQDDLDSVQVGIKSGGTF